MLAILIPTLDRPNVLAGLAANIRDTTPEYVSMIFIVDHADTASQEAVSEIPESRCVRHDGTFPVKTNAGAQATNEPLVLAGADDVNFHPGWYEATVETFQDETVCVAGGPDLTPITKRGTHVTMPIVRRSYIKDPGAAWGETGTLFHAGYHHNYTETELWQLAEHRGVARFVDDIVIEHRHPTWGTAEVDATYRKGGLAHSDDDAARFARRKAQWLA